MRHFALLIVLCLFSISMMGEASKDSTQTVVEATQVAHSDAKTQTTSLKHGINKISYRQYLIGAYGIIAVLAVIVIFLWIRLNNVSAKRKRLRSDFEKFKQATLSQEQVNDLERKLLCEVDRRISQARKAWELKSETRDSRQHPAAPVAPLAQDHPVVCYFESNSGAYFVKVCKAQSTVTAFKVTFTNDSMQVGEFELTDLNKIKSADHNDEVIQLAEGSKRIEAASEIISQVRGKVVREGERWKVVEKLKLKLS